MKWFWVSVAIACSFGISDLNSVDAQDVLVIRRPDGRTTKRTGEIIRWQGSSITIFNGSRERTIDQNDVLELQTNWPIPLEAARHAVANRQFPRAIKSFREAIQVENREWVQAMIKSELIEVFDALENPAAAAKLFLQIYDADSQTRFFPLIPLSWSIGELKPPSSVQSNQWMKSKNPAVQLIGASWQLSVNQNQAVAVLESLAVDLDKRIAQLATAQLWRTRSQSATKVDVDRWSRQLNRIEPTLRSGPLVVLGMAQKRLDQHDQAKINLLKVPILFPQKKSLCAFALFQCGTIMDDGKHRDQAVSVWRELIQDFPTSQYAEFARGKL